MEKTKYKFNDDSSNKFNKNYMPTGIYFGHVVYEDDFFVKFKCDNTNSILLIKKD